MKIERSLVILALISGANFAWAQERCDQVFFATHTVPVAAPSAQKFDTAAIRKVISKLDQHSIEPSLKQAMCEQVFDFVLSAQGQKNPSLAINYLSWAARVEFIDALKISGNGLLSPFAEKLTVLFKDPRFSAILDKLNDDKSALGKTNLSYFFRNFLMEAITRSQPDASARLEYSLKWFDLIGRELFISEVGKLLYPELSKTITVSEFMNILKPISKKMTEDEFILYSTDLVYEHSFGRMILDEPFQPPRETIKRVIRENILKSLGLPFKYVQDVVVVRPTKMTEMIYVSLLTSEPTAHSKNYLGYNVTVFAKLPANSTAFSKVYKWNFANSVAKARVSYEPLKTKNLFPEVASAPRFSEMLSDGSMRGLIFVSKNLGQFGTEVGSYYLDYFSGTGYTKILDSKMPFAKANAAILESVRNGQVDWITRDGHHEINADAVVSFESEVRIVRLKKGADIMTLVISLPPPKKVTDSVQKDHTLTFDALGEAMRARSLNENQILYFDSSCFTGGNLGMLLGLASAPGFTPIGSTKMLETFSGTKGTAIFEFLEGMQERRDYKEINTRIEEEKLVFPSDENYIDANSVIVSAKVTIERDFKTLSKSDEN